jgi:hypothetical protein
VETNPEKPFSRRGRKRASGQLKVMAKLLGIPEPAVPVPAPGLTGQSLDSSELRALAKILGIAGELSSEGISINAPKVAVVGGQSAGKSTIFNVILQEVGSVARFPMGDGTCTKVPTILQLKKGTGYSVEVGPPGGIKTLPPTASSHDVQRAISAAQTEILRAKFPGYKETDIRFSPTPVTLTACTPNIPTEIVLVDLPGNLLQSNASACVFVASLQLDSAISSQTPVLASLLLHCSWIQL